MSVLPSDQDNRGRNPPGKSREFNRALSRVCVGSIAKEKGLFLAVVNTRKARQCQALRAAVFERWELGRQVKVWGTVTGQGPGLAVKLPCPREKKSLFKEGLRFVV